MVRILIATALLVAAFSVNAFAASSDTADVTATVGAYRNVNIIPTTVAMTVGATSSTYNDDFSASDNVDVDSNTTWTITGSCTNLIGTGTAFDAGVTTFDFFGADTTTSTGTADATREFRLSSGLEDDSPADNYTATVTVTIGA